MRPNVPPCCIVLLFYAAALEAHPAHDLATAALAEWRLDPLAVGALSVSSILYAAGVRSIWRRAGRGRGIHPLRVAAFGAALASIAIALLSPIAWLSEILFSAHMTQHEILMLIAAPLLVMGQPLLVALWALPAGWRDRVGSAVRHRGVSSSWRHLTAPAAAFALHAAAIWVWHIPSLYEAAVRSYGIHVLQHLSFLLTAVLFWWGMIHGRYGRAGYGLAVLYVFLTAIHSSILGALLTVAPNTWYPGYVHAGKPWNVNALEDQQLAGLLMWVPAGVVFIVFGLALFTAWLGEAERRVSLGRTAALSHSSLPNPRGRA
jgi:cytochrome c oxidase assembly factor CtaG